MIENLFAVHTQPRRSSFCRQVVIAVVMCSLSYMNKRNRGLAAKGARPFGLPL